VQYILELRYIKIKALNGLQSQNDHTKFYNHIKVHNHPNLYPLHSLHGYDQHIELMPLNGKHQCIYYAALQVVASHP